MKKERNKFCLPTLSFLSASRNMQMQDDGVNIPKYSGDSGTLWNGIMIGFVLSRYNKVCEASFIFVCDCVGQNAVESWTYKTDT